MMRKRIVIDTNVYVSRYLRPGSVPGQAVARAWREADILISLPVWDELRVVLRREKFTRYVQANTLASFLREVWDASELISIPPSIRACRDPRDDKFLEVAVHGRADLILTGDSDLLALHPFQGIAILTPAAFLEAV
jgi:putative PIN family toxin of toxin-antitoxin system